MTGLDANTTFATALVDTWARLGVAHAIVAPGSRSTPLVLALSRCASIRMQVVLDERSAGFTALGAALASGGPTIVACTSGTATANLHPAVVEAHHARVPLFVCTADRPPELQGVGAPQTIDQAHLYGGAVRAFLDPGAPDDAGDPELTARTLAAWAYRAALGSPRGPVHLNLPFREPLVPSGDPVAVAHSLEEREPVDAPSVGRHAVTPDQVIRLIDLVRAHPRGLVVAGWGAGVAPGVVDAFARAAGWPLFADAVSGARDGTAAVSTYEGLVRTRALDALRPTAIVRVGAPLTSKAANAWLGSAPFEMVVDPDGVWLDPDRRARARVVADPSALLQEATRGLQAGAAGEPDWLAGWQSLEAQARVAVDRALDELREPIEARVARDLVAMLPDDSALVVASSVPVRALEWSMAPRSGVTMYSNRGVNGIDGFVSTVLGVAAAAKGPVVGFTGDLGFLHDSNGLLGAAGRGIDATFVVVDNDGGGIFSYLPQAGLAEFEALFATPHGLDLVAVARSLGAHAQRVDDVGAVPGAVKDALGAGGVRVLVVPVDRSTSVDRHRAIWDAVAAAVDVGEA